MPKKELVGKVVSDRMQKTIVVAVEVLFSHPKYEKPLVRTRKFKAHDPEGRCRMGDRVKLQECRPLSKTKRWIVAEVARGEEIAASIDEVSAV